MRDQMTRKEAIDAGWQPIVSNPPREFGGKTTMWESPCGKLQLFCTPTFEFQRKYLLLGANRPWKPTAIRDVLTD